MAAIGGNTLLPLPIPDGPLVPDFAKEMVRRMNLITGAQSGNAPLFSFGANNANVNLGDGGGIAGAPTDITQLVTLVLAQGAQIAQLQTMIDGATIEAVCNGDGTITVTLTWGS